MAAARALELELGFEHSADCKTQTDAEEEEEEKARNEGTRKQQVKKVRTKNATQSKFPFEECGFISVCLVLFIFLFRSLIPSFLLLYEFRT